MRDPVSDVLAARRSNGQSVPPAVVISIALHLALFAPLFLNSGSSDRIAKPAVMIRLAGAAPLGSSSPSPSSTKKAAAIPKAAPPKVAPEVPEPFVPPAAETPVPAPAKSQAARQKDVFGKSNAPLASSQVKAVPSPAIDAKSSQSPAGETSAVTGGTGTVPAIGAAGVEGFEGGDFKFPMYSDKMIQLIGTRWFRPAFKDAPLAKVYFEIERDGRIRKVELKQASGNGTFDRAAIRAVREASPLPPLPYAYSGDYLGVHLTFH